MISSRDMVPPAHGACTHARWSYSTGINKSGAIFGVTMKDRSARAVSPEYRRRACVHAPWAGGTLSHQDWHSRMCNGDDASIGANAVVLKEVPEGSVAVSIPARIIFLRSLEKAEA